MDLGEITKNEIYNESSKSQHYYLFIDIINFRKIERKKGTGSLQDILKEFEI